MDPCVRPLSTAISRILWAASAILAVCVLAGVLEPVASLFRYIPRDYNEGWNAYWADVAWHGGRLYPPVDSSVANNYPPFSFYAVGALGNLLGNSIFAGRLVAFVSLNVIAVNIGLWLRNCGIGRSVAVFSAALFMAAFVEYAPVYLAMDDPQLLAHALILTAVTILWRGDFTRRAMVIASVLMVLGGMTKHLLIPLPLAVTVWIAVYRRQQLMTWLLISLTTLAVAAVLVGVLFGPPFIHDLTSARVYSNLSAKKASIKALRALALVLVAAAPTVLALKSRFISNGLQRSAFLILIYAAFGGLIGVLAAGGAGVDRNAFFDLLIAACLGVGATLEYLRLRPAILVRGPGNPVLMAVVAIGITGTYAAQAAVRWPDNWRLIQQTDLREAQALEDIRAIRAVGRDAAACETLALCYWAGSAFTVDFFNYGQKLRTSAVQVASCPNVFLRGTVLLLQLDSPRGDLPTFRLPRSCNDLIARYYEPTRVSMYGTLMWRR
jgi:hypothetical protein